MQVMIGKMQSEESALVSRGLSSLIKNNLSMKKEVAGHDHRDPVTHHTASLKTTKKKCSRILPGLRYYHEVLLDYEIKKDKIQVFIFN